MPTHIKQGVPIVEKWRDFLFDLTFDVPGCRAFSKTKRQGIHCILYILRTQAKFNFQKYYAMRTLLGLAYFR